MRKLQDGDYLSNRKPLIRRELGDYKNAPPKRLPPPKKKKEIKPELERIGPRETIAGGRPYMQTGGKKAKKPTTVVDEFGRPISAAEARRRDEALTRSLQGYAGTAYTQAQAGKKPRSVSVKKKAAKGISLGMKSVKAGFDKNPGVTRADIIVAGKGKAKRGTSLKKQAAIAIAMKKAGKSPKKAQVGSSMTRMANLRKGGKCKYGC